jgi:glyoxylase I family protein
VRFQANAVHHITLRVSHVQESRRFYEGVLGFELDQAFENKCRLRLGPAPDASRLVLRSPLPGTPAADRFDEHRIGLDHIAIRVTSHEELVRAVEILRDADIATDGIRAVPGGGALVCFRDPDNIQWEFFAD